MLHVKMEMVCSIYIAKIVQCLHWVDWLISQLSEFLSLAVVFFHGHFDRGQL